MRIWQVAAGDAGRDNEFSDVFLDYDVMLLGPSDPGDIRNPKSDYTHLTSAKVGMLRKFADDVEPDDYVVLRVGARAVSIGIVADEDYSWDSRFDDVHGWDLRHTRRVCWCPEIDKPLQRIQANGSLFHPRGRMFSRVNKREMICKLAPLLEQCGQRTLKELPEQAADSLSDDRVGELLFSRGLSQGSVDALLAAIGRQRRMLSWYDEHGKSSGRPAEHEVVAYMVLPLLLALGWSEQLLAIEWQKIDLAAFGATPTMAENCVMVCEAKGAHSSLQVAALEQAKGYVKSKHLDGCQHLLLTQGRRFYLYRRSDGSDWPDAPTGYLNLLKIRSRYVVPPGTSAIDTMMAMTPQAVLGNHWSPHLPP